MAQSFNEIMERNKQDISRINEYGSKKATTLYRNLLFGASSSVVFMFFILFAAQIIKGVFTLIFTCGVGVSLWIGTKMIKAADPVIRQKLRNAKYNAMIKEAKEFSIEQIIHWLELKEEKLNALIDARDQVNGNILKIEGKIGETVDERDIKLQNKMLVPLKKNYEALIETIKEMTISNAQGKKELDRFRNMKDISEMIMNTIEMLDVVNGNTVMEDFLSLAAFESIDTQFNNALATLEGKTMDLENSLTAKA